MIAMICRRGLLTALTSAFLSLPGSVYAQPAAKMPRVGFLGMDSAMQAGRVAELRAGLQALGYVEGKNIAIEYRWAEGRFDRLPELAAELAAQKVDVIVTAGPPAVHAAQHATKTIPIVIAAVHNPVGQGFATTLARPGGNLTGLAFQDEDLSVKRIDYFRQAVPGLAKLAILWNAVEAAARNSGIEVRAYEIRQPADFAAAMSKAKAWGANGVLQISSPFITKHRALFIEQLRIHRFPATCEARMYVIDGCLMAYGASLEAMFRRSAWFVDRILKGADPATLAIEQPREFEFVINKKTAEALGLTIPKSLEFQMTEPLL
jgi:putative ABC transport system substrate-binding protein